MRRPTSSELRSVASVASFFQKACSGSCPPNAPRLCKAASSELVSSSLCAPSWVSRNRGAMLATFFLRSRCCDTSEEFFDGALGTNEDRCK
ncbi:hypothetical protein GOP47_0017659 [Adiantum capillus-veneris]|uniref:Uncharacterized protein n=1 Tax=Adiantum capillus-veneris TaxID=13818 RepID=A0A9D4UFS9_ADICA|nr:hypothetical protein GOP47_0017659 [Adiantum capillus-veneris]